MATTSLRIGAALASVETSPLNAKSRIALWEFTFVRYVVFAKMDTRKIDEGGFQEDEGQK